MSRPLAPFVRGYAIAVIATVLALLLTLLFRSTLERTPAILFFAAIVFSGGAVGLGPGLVATVVSVIFLDYFIFSPPGTFITDSQTVVTLFVFTSVSILVNIFYRRYKLALQLAYQQGEALRVTLASIGDAVIAADAQGKITFLNPTAEVLTGWPLADARGQAVEDIFRIINAKTRKPAENLTAKVLQTGLTFGLANDTALIARHGAEYIIEDGAAPIRDREGKITGIVLNFRDVTEKYKTEARQALLAKVSEEIAAIQQLQPTLSQLAQLIVADFAEWCEITVLADEQINRLVLRHADPNRQSVLEAFYKHLPETWNNAAHVIRTGVPTFDTRLGDRWQVTDDTDPAILQPLKVLQPASQICVPLLIHGRPTGSIGFGRSSDRPIFTQVEATFADELAHRLAIAIENRYLSEQSTQAKQEAEQNSKRIAQLQTITASLSGILLPGQVAQTIVDQTMNTVEGVTACMIALVDEAGRHLKILYGAGYPSDTQSAWATMELTDNLPAADVVRHGEPMFVDTAEWKTRYPAVIDWVRSQSLALLPLRIEEKVIGVIIVSFREHRAFSEADRAFLISVADQCGQALHRAQLYAAEKYAREQMDRILENISDAFFSFDREFRYRYLNNQALRLTGMTREALIGHRPQEFFTDEGDQPFYDNGYRALKENEFIEYERYSPGVKFWASVRMYPHDDGLVVYLQDITARKQAEEEAQLSAIRLKRFVVSGVIGIVTTDYDGRILEANDKFLDMIGYSLSEIEARKIRLTDLTPPEFASLDETSRVVARKTSKAEPYGKEFFHKDGHRVSVLIGGTYVHETWICFVLDLTQRNLAERRLKVLTEVSATLASSLDYRTTLNQITRSIVPAIADWCTIHLLDSDGILQQVAIFHKDAEKIAWGLQIQMEYPEDPNSTTGLYEVVRTGQPKFYPDITDEMLVASSKGDEKLLRLIREIGYSSVIVMPLKAQGQVIGALQLISTESRQRYTAEDVTLAQDIALRAASAIENARLYNDVYQQRERLQVTLNSIGDAAIATDADGCITFVNPIAEALTGWSQFEAVNKNVNDVFQLLDETTQQVPESPVLRVLREGVITNFAGQHTLLVARNGEHIPIDDSAAPINDINGKLIGVILVFRDIRDRRDTEIQLQRTLQRTYDLYNTSRQIGIASTPKDLLDALLTSRYLQNVCQAMIVVFDKPWRDDQQSNFNVVAMLNTTTFPGLAADGMLGKSPLLTRFSGGHSIYIEDVAAESSLTAELRELLTKYQVTSLILLPLWVANVCFGALALYCIPPYRWTDEDFQHIRIFADQVAIVMENVRLFESEKRARREAEYANELKLKFLAMISHELRTPLTSIKGFTSSLLAEDVQWAPEQQYEFINIINNESDKLTDLIGQLLDLSQLQAGMMRIRPNPELLTNIVANVMTQLKALTPNHHLVVNVPDDLPPVLADAPRIAEVISNLVGNAAKYSPEGTTITIMAQRWTNQMLKVDVSDQGPGIPLESRSLVFEAFRQLERKSSERTKGAGLGLAICKGLVETHHGQIWIADEPVSGTTICFTLPLAEAVSRLAN